MYSIYVFRKLWLLFKANDLDGQTDGQALRQTTGVAWMTLRWSLKFQDEKAFDSKCKPDVNSFHGSPKHHWQNQIRQPLSLKRHVASIEASNPPHLNQSS